MKKTMMLFAAIALFFACQTAENNTPAPVTPTVQTINDADLIELKLPKGVKKQQVTWDKKTNTVGFIANTQFSDMPNADLDKEGFYWSVPNSIKTVSLMV